MNRAKNQGPGLARALVVSCLVAADATASAAAAPAAASFARLIAVAAENRSVAAWLKRYRCGLAAARTDHGCSLRRSRAIAGTPTLIIFLCHTARLAALGRRITTLLKECLIGSGEGKVLPAIAACKLNISGHGVSSWCDCTAALCFSVKDSLENQSYDLLDSPVFQVTLCRSNRMT